MKIIILTMSLVIAEYPSPLSALVGRAVPTETLTHNIGRAQSSSTKAELTLGFIKSTLVFRQERFAQASG